MSASWDPGRVAREEGSFQGWDSSLVMGQKRRKKLPAKTPHVSPGRVLLTLSQKALGLVPPQRLCDPGPCAVCL